ncbi:UNVERIFIED_CONTAM: hypothetical protein K2H54_044289 [Gekko kuhli]
MRRMKRSWSKELLEIQSLSEARAIQLTRQAEEAEGERKSLRQELKAARTRIEEQTAQLLAHAGEAEQLRKANSALLTEWASEAEQMRKTHAGELRILREERFQQLESLKKENQGERERSRAELGQELDSQRDYYETLLEKRQEELQEFQNASEEELFRIKADKVNLVLEKQNLADALREVKQENAELLDRAKIAECSLANVNGELSATQSAARYLAEKSLVKRNLASHSSCRQTIASLKEQLGLQRAVISAVHPESLLDLSGSGSESDKEDESQEAKVKPRKPLPINPVNTTTQTVRAGGRISTKTIIENRLWRPEEVRAVADELGSLTRENAVQWLTTATTAYAGLTGEDLTLLARRCATGASLAAINAAVSAGGLADGDGVKWMKQSQRGGGVHRGRKGQQSSYDAGPTHPQLSTPSPPSPGQLTKPFAPPAPSRGPAAQPAAPPPQQQGQLSPQRKHPRFSPPSPSQRLPVWLQHWETQRKDGQTWNKYFHSSQLKEWKGTGGEANQPPLQQGQPIAKVSFSEPFCEPVIFGNLLENGDQRPKCCPVLK